MPSNGQELLAPTGGLSAAKRALLDARLRGAFKGTARLPVIPRRPEDAAAPLSFAQERLWFYHQLEPASPLYNMPLALSLRGPLDAEALGRALSAIVRRHEVLRTRFPAQEGRPVQVVGPDSSVELRVLESDAGSRVSRETWVRRRLREEARVPFDLASDLLLRAVLLRLDDTEHVLLVTMHHIASDGWSWGIFFHELAVLYQDFLNGHPESLPEPALQYADYAVWQRRWLQGDSLERQVVHWKRVLAGAPDFLALPTDRPRPAIQAFRGRCVARELPPELGVQLQDLGRREGVTLFMILLGAFQALLQRYSGQTDLLVGVPVAGRSQRETEDLIGFFINTLVLRGNLSGDPSFRELLARTREAALSAFSCQDLPFERLVEELQPGRSPGHAPLVQVMFVLQNTPVPESRLGELETTPIDIDTGTSKFDLTLAVKDGPGGLAAALEFNSELFDGATATRMLDHWITLLAGAVAEPGRRLSELPLLGPEERHQMLAQGRGVPGRYRRELPVHRVFELQVRGAPDAVAVSDGRESLTYAELNARANRLAHFLRSRGVRPDTPVAVCLPRSLDLIVALVAILKAGGAYVSLDPSYPRERIDFMLADAHPTLVLTTTALGERLPASTVPRVRFDGPEFLAVREASGENSPADGNPESLAYIAYTSGSTGRPKGVRVPHRGVVRLVQGQDYVDLGPDEVILQMAPVAFDASTFEIWGALLNGARLAVLPGAVPTLAELGDAIVRQGVTTLWLTAGLFHQMIDEQWDSLKGVRQLLAGGDVLSPEHVRRALKRLPRCRLINGYGPTENTTFTCCHSITGDSVRRASIPVGRPIANTQVFVLDERMEPVPTGIPGELYTGGDGLARGYLGNEALTDERFVPNPFEPGGNARLYKTGDRVRWLPDGDLEFLGRSDTQVKIRGFRVELEEVEAAIGRHPSVRTCAVIARRGPDGGRVLVACVVARGCAVGADELRLFLREKLPDYLVPSAFEFRAALPLDPNGKVDRRSLAAAPIPAPGDAKARKAPADDTERALAAVWEEILGAGPVGVTDNFFEHGGNSLLMVRLVARIEKHFNRRLPLAAVYGAATIRELAPLVRGEAPVSPGSSLVEIKAATGRPPLFLVHGVGGGMFWGYGNLARHLSPDQPLYAFRSRGLDGGEEFATIEAMAAHYIADMRGKQPRGPYFLGGYCFGGNVAWEMARQLRAAGDEIAFLALMNCTPTEGGYLHARANPAWAARFLQNFFRLSGSLRALPREQRRAYLRWKSRMLLRRMFSRPPAGTDADVESIIDLSGHEDGPRRLWGAHVRALRAYRMPHYDGPVMLIRSRSHQLWCSFARDYGWGEFAHGDVTVRVVPGAHDGILDEPNVGAVATVLEAGLRAP